MIRAGTPADAEAVSELRLRAWHHAYADIVWPELMPTDPETELWRSRLAQEGGHPEILVWDQDGEVVGFVVAGEDEYTEAGEGIVLALYVSPHAQGAGVGTALLEAAVERMRGLGLQRAVLWTFERNERARRFYEHHGWTFDPDAVDPDPRPDAVEVRYSRAL